MHLYLSMQQAAAQRRTCSAPRLTRPHALCLPVPRLAIPLSRLTGALPRTDDLVCVAIAPQGLSLYYLERYAEGAKQFRDDVAVNPNDTEESIWAFMCGARLLWLEA